MYKYNASKRQTTMPVFEFDSSSSSDADSLDEPKAKVKSPEVVEVAPEVKHNVQKKRIKVDLQDIHRTLANDKVLKSAQSRVGMYRQRKVDSSSQESAGKKNSRSVAIYVDVGDAAKVKFQVVQNESLHAVFDKLKAIFKVDTSMLMVKAGEERLYAENTPMFYDLNERSQIVARVDTVVDIDSSEPSEDDKVVEKEEHEDGFQIYLRVGSDDKIPMMVTANMTIGLLKKNFALKIGYKAGDVTLHFDGEKMQDKKNLQFYDLEEDELIDVKIAANAKKQNTPTFSAEKRKSITVHIQGTDASTIACTAPMTTKISALMDAYCKKSGLPRDNIKFMQNDKELKPTQTMQGCRMKDGAILSVNQVAAKKIAVNKTPATQPIPTEDTVSIELRCDNYVQQKYTIDVSTSISKLIQSFAIKHQLNAASIRLVFEGCSLQVDRTLKSYEIEHNDVIDVILSSA